MPEKRVPCPEDIKGEVPPVKVDTTEPRPPQVPERRDAGSEKSGFFFTCHGRCGC
ncbi:MAG: hypothetical protein ABII02_00925 [Candidatus Magasanikbacteria bacterium]